MNRLTGAATVVEHLSQNKKYNVTVRKNALFFVPFLVPFFFLFSSSRRSAIKFADFARYTVRVPKLLLAARCFCFYWYFTLL